MTITALAPVSRSKTSVRQMIATYFQKRRQIAERRQTVRALSGLDGHALKDLAISRCEILSVAYADPTSRKRGFSQ
ncbi:MAG: DUF1127 domain-containing protein [Rhizobiaceae bacterium]